jgi:hypothetical protein
VAKEKASKKQLLDFEGSSSFQAQSKLGFQPNFDMIALAGLAYAIYTIGPKTTTDAVLGFWGDAFGAVAAGIGEAIGGFFDWTGKGIGNYMIDIMGARELVEEAEAREGG